MLPGTMRLSRVGFDTWAHLWLNQCVHVCHVQYEHVYSYFCILYVRGAVRAGHSAAAASLSARQCVMCVYVYSSVCVHACVCLWSGCDVEHLPSPPSHAAVWRLLSWNLPDDIIKWWQGRQVRAPVVVVGKGYSPTHVTLCVWVQAMFPYWFSYWLQTSRQHSDGLCSPVTPVSTSVH